MKIVLLDDFKSRNVQVTDALEKSKHKVVSCSGSNDFIAAVEEQSMQVICMDFDSWHHGRSIYSYMNLLKKMESVPVILYNTPPKIAAIGNRTKHEKDVAIVKPAEIKAIMEAVASIA
jgi:DNA-binding NtrC family response regulator